VQLCTSTVATTGATATSGLPPHLPLPESLPHCLPTSARMKLAVMLPALSVAVKLLPNAGDAVPDAAPLLPPLSPPPWCCCCCCLSIAGQLATLSLLSARPLADGLLQEGWPSWPAEGADRPTDSRGEPQVGDWLRLSDPSAHQAACRYRHGQGVATQFVSQKRAQTIHDSCHSLAHVHDVQQLPLHVPHG
jgi:hypothetical protein